jgi:hypothetical protein
LQSFVNERQIVVHGGSGIFDAAGPGLVPTQQNAEGLAGICPSAVHHRRCGCKLSNAETRDSDSKRRR